jgi:tetratricopeptide (TPR) repeat protein
MADTARIEELRRRVQMDPASIAFAALAEEYRRARRFDDAIATCRTGLQRHPAYLSARVTLGRSLLEIGRFDEARQELEHVLRVAPENLAAIRALAEIHHRAGELPEEDVHFPAVEVETVPNSAPAAPPQVAPVSSAGVLPPGEAPAASAAGPALAPPPVPQAAVPATRQVTAPIPPRAAASVLAAVAPSLPKVADPIPGQIAAPVPRQAVLAVPAPNPTPSLRPPVPTSRQPHPDEVALPALEVFLSAIVAARTSGNRVSS